jgi:hypothetical protein
MVAMTLWAIVAEQERFEEAYFSAYHVIAGEHQSGCSA